MVEGHLENLEQALDKARREIKLLDPTWMASRSGTIYDFATASFSVPFFGEAYRVEYPKGSVLRREDGSQAGDREALIILHYLIQADGTPLKGEWVAYRDLPGARYHEPAFVAEVERPLSRGLAGRLDSLRFWVSIAANPVDIAGDIAFNLFVLPRVSLLIIFNEQDEEFAASARVLFDICAPNYLPTEDLSILAELATAHILENLETP